MMETTKSDDETPETTALLWRAESNRPIAERENERYKCCPTLLHHHQLYSTGSSISYAGDAARHGRTLGSLQCWSG